MLDGGHELPVDGDSGMQLRPEKAWPLGSFAAKSVKIEKPIKYHAMTLKTKYHKKRYTKKIKKKKIPCNMEQISISTA